MTNTTSHNEMLENVIALDEEGLEREIAFAEGSIADDFPETHQWLGMLREELAERRQRRADHSA